MHIIINMHFCLPPSSSMCRCFRNFDKYSVSRRLSSRVGIGLGWHKRTPTVRFHRQHTSKILSISLLPCASQWQQSKISAKDPLHIALFWQRSVGPRRSWGTLAGGAGRCRKVPGGCRKVAGGSRSPEGSRRLLDAEEFTHDFTFS